MTADHLLLAFSFIGLVAVLPALVRGAALIMLVRRRTYVRLGLVAVSAVFMILPMRYLASESMAAAYAVYTVSAGVLALLLLPTLRSAVPASIQAR